MIVGHASVVEMLLGDQRVNRNIIGMKDGNTALMIASLIGFVVPAGPASSPSPSRTVRAAFYTSCRTALAVTSAVEFCTALLGSEIFASSSSSGHLTLLRVTTSATSFLCFTHHL